MPSGSHWLWPVCIVSFTHAQREILSRACNALSDACDKLCTEQALLTDVMNAGSLWTTLQDSSRVDAALMLLSGSFFGDPQSRRRASSPEKLAEDSSSSLAAEDAVTSALPLRSSAYAEQNQSEANINESAGEKPPTQSLAPSGGNRSSKVPPSEPSNVTWQLDLPVSLNGSHKRSGNGWPTTNEETDEQAKSKTPMSSSL